MYRGVIDAGDGTQHLYYFGQQGTHAHQDCCSRGKFGVGRARILKDRWVALGVDVPRAGPGSNGSGTNVTMTTRPIILPRCAGGSGPGPARRAAMPGNVSLTLNAEVSVGGRISVAVLFAESGGPVPGFDHADAVPIYGNRLAAPVQFGRSGTIRTNTLALPAVLAPVRLEFKLLAPALIFAWEFTC